MAAQLVSNLASSEDVEATLGRLLTSSERTQVQTWLDDAQIIIAHRMGDLTLLNQALLAYVVREAVAMKVKRPDPAARTTITVDDGSVSKSYDKDRGVIEILPEWWDLLTPGRPAGVAAFSMRVNGLLGQPVRRGRCW